MASLLDDKMRSIGSAKGTAAAGKNQTTKLVAAAVLFVVAGGVFAWYQGWIFASEPEKAPPPTAEQIQAHQEGMKRTEQLKQQNKVVQSGAE